MANFFYRAMGARISANCMIGDYITECDLIESKGDIRTGRVLSAAFIENGELFLTPVCGDQETTSALAPTNPVKSGQASWFMSMGWFSSQYKLWLRVFFIGFLRWIFASCILACSWTLTVVVTLLLVLLNFGQCRSYVQLVVKVGGDAIFEFVEICFKSN
jgi:hypothetical protein